MFKRQWPTQLELDTCLTLAAAWFKCVRVERVQAWPVSAGGSEASLWGGTVDAVCAIDALRGSGHPAASALDDVSLQHTGRWLESRQKKNGSFPSDEFSFAGAEPTAWALIALHKITPATGTATVNAALAYLETCFDSRDGSVSSTPGGGDLPRTMPSALTLWAFSLWGHRREMCDRIVVYLLRCQDNASHGWGVDSSARPNPATTAQVLVAFQQAGVPADTFRLAAEYVLNQQRESGRWTNGVDEWYAPNDRTRAQVTNKCANSGTAWCLLALARLNDRRSRSACLRAVRYLLDTQSKSGADLERGSWRLSDHGAPRHVWLNGQVVVALEAWRSSLPRQGIRREGVRLMDALLRVADVIVARASLIAVLGVLAAVVALTIDTGDTGFRDQFVGDGATFRQSLLTSGLSAAAIGAISWIYRGARDWRVRRRRK